MDTLYGKAVALAVPVFLALIALEFLIDRMRGTRYYHLADSINSLSCGIVSTGVRVFFGFLGIFFYEWVYQHWSLTRLPANHWGTWVFAFIFYDLCYYWNHRLGHTVGLFWASHVVHHQSEEFNLTTALRQPGTGSFTGWIFYLPMALAGIPIGIYLLVGVIQLFYQFWPHTRLIGRMGFLDHWIQTPSNHRVHHAQNDIYCDKNYVGVFLVWDHLFGSFQEELEEEPCIYGIRGQLKSWNPVWANFHYYWTMLKDSWHAGSWKDKFKVWFAHPGWRPQDVTSRFPKPAYDPHRDFVKYDPPCGVSLSVYGLVQFVALIGANSHFLALLPKQSTEWNVAYFLFILSSLVTLGGVLENRRSFFILESIRLAAIALALLITNGWFGGVHDARILIAIEVFALGWLVWLWWASRTNLSQESATAAA